MKKKVTILTGAGISAESGIKTFRDADGLWEGHDVMEVASPEGYSSNKALVLEFYNQRRRQLNEVEPNAAHRALVKLEQKFDVTVITQNVDNLHERAGSSQIIHLHGELIKARSDRNPELIEKREGDIVVGDLASDGAQLRPHIVWFGEAVPMIEKAVDVMTTSEITIIIGTSMQVYPAAGLVAYAPRFSEIYYIDPKPTISHELSLLKNLRVIEKTATAGVPDLVSHLLDS